MHSAITDTSAAASAAVQVSLRKGALVRSCGRIALRVLRGRLWITRSGDPRDLFVSAGERIDLPGNSKTLIEADFETVVELAAGAGRLQRTRDEAPRLIITPNCWAAG